MFLVVYIVIKLCIRGTLKQALQANFLFLYEWVIMLNGEEGKAEGRVGAGLARKKGKPLVVFDINYFLRLFQINRCCTMLVDKIFCKRCVFVQDMRRVWASGREDSAHASQDQAASRHGFLHQVLPHHIHGQGKGSYPQVYQTSHPTHGLHQSLGRAALSQRQYCQLAQAHQTHLWGV